MVEICTVGGYNEVGKNMTALKIKDEVVILDMGLDLERYINYKGEDDIGSLEPEELARIGAVPDISLLNGWAGKVRAIIPSHGHLDHIGAIPMLADQFKAPVYCSPFTKKVIDATLKDNEFNMPNKIIGKKTDSNFKISKHISIEFIHITHSIPQAAIVAIHTPHGIIIYANDFKLDNYPTLGPKPNFKRLEELGKSGRIRLLIVDSLYAGTPRTTPSESVAKEMLKNVMLGVPNKGAALIVTTFSSHIARLKSIIEFGKKLNRKVIFLGRSLAKYSYAAEDLGIVKFSKQVEICAWRSQITRALRKVEKQGRDKYLLVVTGHQGEPGAVLSRLADQELHFEFFPQDQVIFSCTVIPSPINVSHREILEGKLKDLKVRIFRDIHVSGHASREDHRDLITILRPEHIIPAHGDLSKTRAMVSLAREMGYGTKEVHLMQNGQQIKLNI